MPPQLEISSGSKVRNANRLWEVAQIEGASKNRKITQFNEKAETVRRLLRIWDEQTSRV